jgi:hypothetical protein
MVKIAAATKTKMDIPYVAKMVVAAMNGSMSVKSTQFQKREFIQ